MLSLSKSTFQKIFGVLAAFSSLLLVYYIFLSISFYNAVRELKPAGMEDLPDFVNNFWLVLASALVLHITKRVVMFSTEGLFRPYCKNQEDPEICQKRAKKAASKLYKGSFYIVATYIGWLILKDTEIYPALLGGPDSTGKALWDNCPWSSQVPFTFLYSMWHMGYHVEELIDHIFLQDHSTDFYDMLLHHIATITLFGGMLVNNALRVGVVIAWVHDVADVPIAFSQLFSQLKLSNTSAVTFFGAVFTWFYTRLVVFPWLIWTTYQYYVLPAQFNPIYNGIPRIKIFLLCVLFCLHVYWFVLFLGIIASYCKTGKTEDTVNQVQKTQKAL